MGRHWRSGCGAAVLIGCHLAACAQPWPLEPSGWSAAVGDAPEWLWPDGAPLALRDVWPAGGPIRRLTARPGAWYAMLMLPLATSAAVQLWFWPQRRGGEQQPHELRLLALDAPPQAAPSIVVPVPIAAATARATTVLRSAPIVLRADSTADTAVLLIEQWSPSGRRPGVLRVQARSMSMLMPEREASPWWSAGADDAAAGASLARMLPPSPSRAMHPGRAVELSIRRREGAAPSADTWRTP